MQQDIYQGQKLWNDEEPSPLAIELAKLLTSGTVLDLGAGKGRNALYLALQGFNVVAVEIDKGILEELKRKNDSQKQKVSIVESDINNFQPTQKFDAIICDMVLHFLPFADIRLIVEKMKLWTKEGGYNVVTGYSDKNGIGKRPYLFKHNELKSYYKDWEIVSYEEKPTDWFIKPGENIPRRNQAVYLLARKK